MTYSAWDVVLHFFIMLDINSIHLGNGGGSVGILVASDPREPVLETNKGYLVRTYLSMA